MSYLLWQRGETAIGARRLVLRAAEVPVMADALALREQLEALVAGQARRLAAAEAEARAAGHAAGLEEGRRAARDEAAAVLLSMTQAAARQRDALCDQVAALALQVARKLLGRLADEERLLGLADTAAREMLPAGALVLTVHPDQVDAVRARLAAWSAGAAMPHEAPVGFEVRGEPGAPPGLCRVESALGSVDATLDTQLAALAAAWGVDPGRAADDPPVSPTTALPPATVST